jgi:hypothetical protein
MCRHGTSTGAPPPAARRHLTAAVSGLAIHNLYCKPVPGLQYGSSTRFVARMPPCPWGPRGMVKAQEGAGRPIQPILCNVAAARPQSMERIASSVAAGRRGLMETEVVSAKSSLLILWLILGPWGRGT